MKITICGSTAFIEEMEEVSKRLETIGHEVKFPPVSVVNERGETIYTRDYYEQRKSMSLGNVRFWEKHTVNIKNHFAKVAWSDAVLITNYNKNGIDNYIGPNTLMEMGVAFYLGKKIFLLNPVPKIAWAEEILGMRPIIIGGDFQKIL